MIDVPEATRSSEAELSPVKLRLGSGVPRVTHSYLEGSAHCHKLCALFEIFGKLRHGHVYAVGYLVNQAVTLEVTGLSVVSNRPRSVTNCSLCTFYTFDVLPWDGSEGLITPFQPVQTKPNPSTTILGEIHWGETVQGDVMCWYLWSAVTPNAWF